MDKCLKSKRWDKSDINPIEELDISLIEHSEIAINSFRVGELAVIAEARDKHKSKHKRKGKSKHKSKHKRKGKRKDKRKGKIKGAAMYELQNNLIQN